MKRLTVIGLMACLGTAQAADWDHGQNIQTGVKLFIAAYKRAGMAGVTTLVATCYQDARKLPKKSDQKLRKVEYIDVPFAETDPVYQKIRDYLGNPDGTMKVIGITFCYWPLESAMQNAHHDAPGFWEEWA